MLMSVVPANTAISNPVKIGLLGILFVFTLCPGFKMIDKKQKTKK